MDGFSNALIQSVLTTVLRWAAQPEEFSSQEAIEERSMDGVAHWITEELLQSMKNWFYELNHRTSRLLDAYFAQTLKRESVGFPLLYMGEFQLYMAREITYDLTVMANDRINSYHLSRMFRPPHPDRDGKRARGFRLAHYGGKLAEFFEQEGLELRLRLNAYFLSEEFLSRYRDCVLEAARRWAGGWEEDPHWGGLLPFDIRTPEEDQQLSEDVIDLLDGLTPLREPE